MYGDTWGCGMLIRKDNLNRILPENPDLFMASDAATQGPHCLASSISALDQFFDGGLRFGELSEWGAPLGRGGRDIIIRYLTRRGIPAEDKHWCLWICGKTEVKVYPPAWMARGVDLSSIRFTYCSNPVRELKPVFMDPFFRVIIMDAPKHLSTEDCAFIAQRARANKQAIIMIRDHFLSPSQGNVWARLRLNCWQDEDGGRFHVRIIRGLSPRELSLAATIFD